MTADAHWKLDVDRKALVRGNSFEAIARGIPRALLCGVSQFRVQLQASLVQEISEIKLWRLTF